MYFVVKYWRVYIHWWFPCMETGSEGDLYFAVTYLSIQLWCFDLSLVYIKMPKGKLLFKKIYVMFEYLDTNVDKYYPGAFCPLPLLTRFKITWKEMHAFFFIIRQWQWCWKCQVYVFLYLCPWFILDLNTCHCIPWAALAFCMLNKPA